MSFTVQPRSVPIGRDWLGLHLSSAGGHLIDTDSEYAIGLKDFLVEFWSQPGIALTPTTYCIQVTSGAATMQCGLSTQTQKLIMYLGSTNVGSDVVSTIGSSLVHGMMAVDRDVAVYYHANGDDAGKNTGLIGESSTDVDSTACTIGGVTMNNRPLLQSIGRLIIFPTGVFPTEAQLDQIATERYLNPWEESPTLLKVLGNDHDAALRVGVDLVDVDQDGGTVPNKGTGGDFIIGGSLDFRDVRTVVEEHAIIKPPEDWFTFDPSHEGRNAGADLGFSAAGSYIYETVYKSFRVGTAISGYMSRIRKSVDERFYLWRNTADGIIIVMESNGISRTCTLRAAGYSDYGIYFTVVHQVYDPVAKKYYVLINGQRIVALSVITDIDLSGDCIIELGDDTAVGEPLGARIWHGAGVAPPTGWAKMILDRVHNPWIVDGAFEGMVLHGNWEGRAGAQKPSSLILPNQAQPGTGDLPISGGDTWGESRVLVMEAAC